jgi:hypothetical protein
MSKPLTIAVLIVAATAGSAAARAETAFEPLAPCTAMLSETSDIPQIAVGFWAFGFLDAATGKAHHITPDRLDRMMAELRDKCAASPGGRLYDIAAAIAAGEKSAEPAVADAGRALLRRFFDPAEDHGALTLSLKPAPEDVRAVYAEPLATSLIKGYEQMFQPGAVIEPKPEHKQLFTTFTTTGHLKAGDPVLDEFPGGYRDVLNYFVGDVPIAQFKFVAPGETLGLSFDGLIFVNDHWVFMPKPWRALPQ